MNFIRSFISIVDLTKKYIHLNVIRPINKVILRKVTGLCEIERALLKDDIDLFSNITFIPFFNKN